MSAHSLATADAQVLHIVGRWWGLLDRLGVAVPRSLCGVRLVADPDRPWHDSDDWTLPVCPACAAKARRRCGDHAATKLAVVERELAAAHEEIDELRRELEIVKDDRENLIHDLNRAFRDRYDRGAR